MRCQPTSLERILVACPVQACPVLRTFDLTGCALVGDATLVRAEAHCRREPPEEAPAKARATKPGGSPRSSTR